LAKDLADQRCRAMNNHRPVKLYGTYGWGDDDNPGAKGAGSSVTQEPEKAISFDTPSDLYYPTREALRAILPGVQARRRARAENEAAAAAAENASGAIEAKEN
jgi:hypothetical protein